MRKHKSSNRLERAKYQHEEGNKLWQQQLVVQQHHFK
jgi:hypothetical protein